MSTKRPPSSLVDPSPPPPPKVRAMSSRRFIDPHLVLEGLEKKNLSSDDAVMWIKNLMKMAIAMPAGPEKPPKKSQKILSSSTLDMTDIQNLLKVTYSDESKESVWKITVVDEPPRMGTTWVETGLREIKSDPDWGVETCEALTRTLVDLLIFDRKCLLSQTSQFHSLRLVGEYAISTKTIEDSTIINGRCDLVLGYGGHPRKKDISFGLVAIEVKKRYGLGTTASAQLVAYLVGLHQRRKAANKIVQFVYGIATDGVNFIFHRLDNDLRLQCATVIASEKALIYRYIDIILESAIRSTPNTSPHSKFPTSADSFHRNIEVPLWTHAVPYAKAIVEVQDFDYVIVADENGDPCLRQVGGNTGDDDEAEDEDEEVVVE